MCVCVCVEIWGFVLNASHESPVSGAALKTSAVLVAGQETVAGDLPYTWGPSMPCLMHHLPYTIYCIPY